MADDERKPMANITPFGLRMQPDLKARVEEASRANNRSLNAEIVDRLEGSFVQPSEALLEATLVAELLRQNLTERIESYTKLMDRAHKREASLNSRENEFHQNLAERSEALQAEWAERHAELEAEYDKLMQSARRRFEEADTYADFTIARERQFIETIKALTGKEPPAVEPAPKRKRS